MSKSPDIKQLRLFNKNNITIDGVRVLIEERKNEIGRTIFEFLVDVGTISRVGVAAYDQSSGMTEALSFGIELITYLSNI
ncbi:hypothetical protein V1478_014788 [Vespula squamosa]|uniref:DUF4371 domain-containing protein n=1 Tax=Vespula squamosa TaxID=30214 RepID=A0ABD2A5N8_VESSQ